MTRRSSPFHVFPAGVACLLLASSGLPAQEPGDTIAGDTATTPVYEIEGLRIVVSRPGATTGGSSAVEVRLDSLMVGPAPTLEQVLREMPLIQIRSNSRGEVQPALRGSEDRQIAVLVDGVPLSLGWDHRTDLSVIPLTAAGNVTLLRGLSSVLHGPNVLGGVVEIDVARGRERQQPPEPLTLSMGVDHEGGRSVGATGGVSADSEEGNWIVRGGAGYRKTPGFRLPGDEDLGLTDPERRTLLTDGNGLRLNSDVEHYDGFVAARYLHEEGRWLSLSASGFGAERGVPPESHTTDPRLWRYPSQNRILAALSGGTGHRDTPWGEGDLEMSLGVDLGSTEIDAYATPAFDEVVGGEDSDDRTVTVRLLGDHTLGSSGDLRGALTYADVSHDEVLDPGGPGSYRQRLWSLGSEVEWRFGMAGTRTLSSTSLNVGLAVDGADTPESGDKPPLGALWDWGARVGASAVSAGGSGLLHGAVSRRARFPSLRELYSGALGRFVPNPGLAPEVLTGGELGATYRGTELEVQVVGFHQVLSDGIVRATVELDGDRKFRRENRDEVRSTGLELLASGALGPVTWSGDVTLQRVRVEDPGDPGRTRPEYEPEVAGKLDVAAPLPLDLVGSGELRYLGAQYCVNPDEGGLDRIGSSRIVDLGFRRRFSWTGGAFSRLEAALSLDNAADEAVYDQCGLPNPGRTLRIQLRLW